MRGLLSRLVAVCLAMLTYSCLAWGGDPLPGVMFVSDDIFGDKHENPDYPRPGTNHWREGYLYHRATTQHILERTTTPTRPGRNLYTLIPASPAGTLRRITHLTDGEVFDPEPSYDGHRILFSMRRDGEDWFNLYEIGAAGTGLVQLTDGPFNDVSGVYLPDGRIVFVSDRAGYLEEYHEERTETLWIMNADGTGIEQLTFNPGTVFDPTVLADGRILFSMWDTFMLNLPPADKHETYLMTIRPDGTDEGHYFGAREHPFFNRERHSGVALTQSGQMPDGTILVQSEMGPSILDLGRGLTAWDALWPIFPGTTSVQLGGATHRVHLSPTGSRTTPYPLPDGRILLAATLPGARDLGIYLAHPATRQMELVFNDPETAEFDPRPIFLERPLPAILPPKGRFEGGEARASRNKRVTVTPRARFVVAAGRRSDDLDREKALARARYFQVVEALHTAVTSSSHTNLATRILGVVPISADGSAYFEAPADTPLFLEPLDAAGRRLEFDWQHPETSVPVGSKQILTEMTYITARPGETKACGGCHTAVHESVDPETAVTALARAPVQVERDTTDLVYRRNEPDEYRCQARIGEVPKYRPWLTSPKAELRRRACELLAAIEDGAETDVEAMARLLKDRSAAVRRAAGRALARLGTPECVPSLIDAMEDADWQVRFHVAAALEAITACVPPGDRHGDSARQFYIELVDDLGEAEGVRKAIGRGPTALSPFAQHDGDELLRRWFEAAGRLGPDAPNSARQIIRRALDLPIPPPPRFEPWAGKRYPLDGEPPEPGAIRAAGKIRDSESVARLVPWLSRAEYQDHATEAAVALGRIGTPGAVDALWTVLRQQVPELKPFQNRYLQQGPRPEEYAILRGLILAGAAPAVEDVSLVVAMLPGSFLEKPRYEDRLRPESQRVLLGRLLLERAGFRKRMVTLLADVLAARPPATDDSLYAEILEGINLERPFAEHRRPFPVVEQIDPEQALWLLGCLAVDRKEVPEQRILPFLASENWRERIDAAVLLDVLGFGSQGGDSLFREATKPYPFSEIMGIGKSHPDTNFRDKCYMVAALAHHIEDAGRLETLANPRVRYRDVRYGLAIGLGRRRKLDGIELLSRLATTDPISVVRREARQSLRGMQEFARLEDLPVPMAGLGETLPFEAWYAPRGLTWPGPVVVHPATDVSEDWTVGDLERLVMAGLEQGNYRDLNNSNNQAPGATAMMIRGIGSFDQAVTLLAEHSSDSIGPLLEQLINSPYPFAHFLALREYSRRVAGDPEQLLIAQLDRFAGSSDTVRFYWACEALADRGVEAALPELVRLASSENTAGLHGPLGMGLGYPSAKALARLTGQINHHDVQRLLASENIWLRAGTLAGLTEARAPGIESLLREIQKQHPSGVVFDHARVGLAQLRGGDGLRRAHLAPD